MKLKKGDKVKVISGKDKGKISTVLAVFHDKNKVLVEGVNKVKRHVKPGAVSEKGGVVAIERPFDASNVMFYNAKIERPVRLGFITENGKKIRVCKKTGDRV